MYYKLNEKYHMRGWKNVPYVLLNQNIHPTFHLTKEEFQVLLLCDGITEYDEDLFTESMKNTLYRFLNKGIVEEMDSMQEIHSKQYYKYYNNRYIQSVIWSITGRCNLQCKHCYMDAPSAKFGEISTLQAKQIINQFVECGVYHVSLTGGEPLVRKDFWELVDYLLERNIHIDTIYTNGWLVNESFLEKCTQRQIKPRFSFSYDGFEQHDWLRGVIGAEARVTHAIQLCHEKGYPMEVEMCLHQRNRHTIASSIDYLVSIGVENIRLGAVINTDLWKEYGKGYEYSIREYYEDIIEYIPYYYKENVQANILAGDVISLKKNTKTYSLPAYKYDGCTDHSREVLCGCAYNNLYITPDGRLMPCLPMTSSSIQSQFPMILEIGLRQALLDTFYARCVSMTEKELVEHNSTCAKCEYLKYCGGGCRATALLNKDSYFGVDTNQCLLWKEGYLERIQQAIK